MISGRSSKRRRAPVSLFVCARVQSDFACKIILIIISAMLDEIAWLFNLRGNEYVDRSSRLPDARMLIGQQHSL